MWTITRKHRVPCPGFFRVHDSVYVDSEGRVGKTDTYVFDTDWYGSVFSPRRWQRVKEHDDWLVLEDGTRFKNVSSSRVLDQVTQMTCGAANNDDALSLVKDYMHTGQFDHNRRHILSYNQVRHISTHGTTLVRRGDWSGNVIQFNAKGGGRVFLTNSKTSLSKEEEWSSVTIKRNTYVH